MKTKSYLHIVITIIFFFLFSSAIWGRIDFSKPRSRSSPRAAEYRRKLDGMKEKDLERREAIRLERKQRKLAQKATNEPEFRKNKIARLERKIIKLETMLVLEFILMLHLMLL